MPQSERDNDDNITIPGLVDNLHRLMESNQVPADVAITSLVSTAGEIALGMAVAHPERKEVYLKVFNNAAEQVRKQLVSELQSRGL